MHSAGVLAVDSSSIMVALIVGGFAFAGLVLQGRQRREDKEQDWRRQDELLKRADVAVTTAEATTAMQREGIAAQAQQAEQQRGQAEEAALLLARNNEDVAQVAAKTTEQLQAIQEGNKIIHTLVNSTLTGAITSDLNSKRDNLASMRRIIAMLEEDGKPVPIEDRAAVEVIEQQIADLEADLAVRTKQNALADRQLAEMGPEAAAKIVDVPPEQP